MRYWLVVGLICVLQFQTFAGEIPQVPSHMEFAGMKLRITESARREIQKHVNALRASDKYFKIKLDRVNLYFPIIEKVFKDAKLPDDFKYLAIQESALIADAVSSANAVGFWQFKSFTGREVGLRIDDRIDERMNIVSASRGAAKYMKTNNFYYNNWIFALTAYNTGRGGARKFVDENLYGVSKMTIDKKTHWYVKTFLAHKIAFENEIGGAHSKGLKLVEYTKGGGKTIAKIARDLDMDVEKLKDYNVWLKRGTIPEDKSYAVILPVQGKLGKQAKDLIAKNDKKNPSKDTSQPTGIKQTPTKKYPSSLKAGLENAAEVYIKINGIPSILARTGDTPETLAAKGSIPLHRFKKYNDLSPDDKVNPGLLYYTRTKKWASKIPFHIAQSGESMWSVAQKYGIKKSRLARLNRIDSEAKLKPGQVMWLNKRRPKNLPIEYREVTKNYELSPLVYTNKKPTTSPIVTETALNKNNQPTDTSSSSSEVLEPINPEDYDIHTVAAKETLYGISRKYGMNVDEIIELNRIDPYNMTIEIDQKLYVKKQEKPVIQTEITTENANQNSQITKVVNQTNNSQTAAIDSTAIKNAIALPKALQHVVQQGESLYAISKKYGITVEELLKWNGLSMSDAINIDQKLKILTSESQTTQEVPKTNQETKGANSDSKFHIVTPGDTLYSIARKYEITVEDLIKWNNKSDPKINIGERLKVEE